MLNENCIKNTNRMINTIVMIQATVIMVTFCPNISVVLSGILRFKKKKSCLKDPVSGSL